MPNWIKNRILVGKPELMEAIRAKYDNEGQLDLGKIKSVPEDLNIEYGSTSEDGLRLYLTRVSPNCKWAGTKEDKMTKKAFADLLEKVKARTFGSNGFEMTEEDAAKLQAKYKDRLQTVTDLGKKQVDNLAKYGAMNWYEWAIKNWGTKWNSSNTEWGEKNVTFETAWDPALPAIIELSKQNPNIRMAVLYSDEDIGSHVGYMLLTGGRIDYEGTFPDQSRDAYKLAFDLWGCGDEYRYDEKEGTYKRKEE